MKTPLAFATRQRRNLAPIRTGLRVCLAVWALLAVGCGGSQDSESPRTLTLYCAASAKPPVEELLERYETEYGVRVQVQYGGSGTLLSNLKIAKTGDLYLAADSSYTDIARREGLVAEVLPLAKLTPVIAVPAGNPQRIQGLDDLLRPGVRLALGNPEAASIGKQTRERLRASGHWSSIKQQAEQNGVFMPTVPELANAVVLRAVDAAIVWDATARQHAAIEIIHDPVLAAKTQTVAIGVLQSTQAATAALHLARFLNSEIGNEFFAAHRFEPIQGDRWSDRPELTFFCGAVNRRAIEPVLRAFQEREGVTINTVYNECGILTGQMKSIRFNQTGAAAGFPDVYMACDHYDLDTVQDWFLPGRNISIAPIVIAVPRGNPAGIRNLEDLARPGVRVTVGQPEQCTVGALTRILLEQVGLKDAVMANVVMQTASSAMLVPTVATRSADATIAYETDTLREDRVAVIPIDHSAALATQPFAVSRHTAHPHLSQRLLDAVLVARAAFQEAGFTFIADGPVR
ncbi:MAG: substrate-binding domain-containing protein [Opitutales bacterium]